MTTEGRRQPSQVWLAIVVGVVFAILFPAGDGHALVSDASTSPPTSQVAAQPAGDDDVAVADDVIRSVVERGTRSVGQEPASGPSFGANVSTLIPDASSHSSLQLYALLVEVLERLNVLAPTTTSCYQLQKIVHEVLPSADPSNASRTVGVSLVFKESPLTSVRQNEAVGASASRPSSADKGAAATSDVSEPPSGSAKNECASAPDVVLSMNAQPLIEVLNDTLGRRVDASLRDTNSSGDARLDGQNEAGGVYQYTNNGKQESVPVGGLSRTQVVVISTCSAIIALFFLVAAILRVRNYIKRIREEQALRERPTFRSCSVRLRSASQSNDHLRRDSQTSSKLSHQSNYNIRSPGYSHTNGSSSRENSNASSPRHDPDTKPLLVVTAVAEGHSPTVSQSSLQFIDEEPPKKMNGRHNIRSDADDAESRPLLISETCANSPQLSPTSPTEAGFRVNHLPGRTGAFKGMPCSLPVKSISSNSSDSQAYYQKVSESPSPVSGVGGASCERGVPETSLEGDLGKKSASTKEDRMPPFSDVNGSPAVPLIRFCGLTQSDSSLSSTDGNRNYNYGNQVEYSPPEWGTASGGEYLNGLNSPYALSLLSHPHAVLLAAHTTVSSDKGLVSTGCDSAFSCGQKASGDKPEKRQCVDALHHTMNNGITKDPYQTLESESSGNVPDPIFTEPSHREQSLLEQCTGKKNGAEISTLGGDVVSQSGRDVSEALGLSSRGQGLPSVSDCHGLPGGSETDARLTHCAVPESLRTPPAETKAQWDLMCVDDVSDKCCPRSVDDAVKEATSDVTRKEDDRDFDSSVPSDASELATFEDNDTFKTNVISSLPPEEGTWAASRSSPRGLHLLGEAEEREATRNTNVSDETNHTRTPEVAADCGVARSAPVDGDSCCGLGSSSSKTTASAPQTAAAEKHSSDRDITSPGETRNHAEISLTPRPKSAPPLSPSEPSSVVKKILSLDGQRTTFL